MSTAERVLSETPPCPAPRDGVRGEPRYGSWHEAIKDAVRDPVELCRLVGLDHLVGFDHLVGRARLAGQDHRVERPHAATWKAARDFPVFAPRGYIARMRPGDEHDPLLRQVLPLEDELTPVAGYSHDPVGDRAATHTPGLLHKYDSRVLMVTTGACAVHCRYCFRRHFPYQESPKSVAAWQPALAEIAADSSLREVILSGGDPLMLVDRQLAELAERLAAIPHLRRLRIHTRLPIMIPERVNDELLDWLRGTRLAPIMVVHANHVQELSESVAAALGKLVDAGIPVLNQAVLLRGVNDQVDALAELCERLVDLRVMPYYLHQLDRVAGAAHFEVPVERGLKLVAELRSRLPGYAVPRYVCEIAGEPNKRVLS